jgi:ABC-type arginine transport system permease subunit
MQVCFIFRGVPELATLFFLFFSFFWVRFASKVHGRMEELAHAVIIERVYYCFLNTLHPTTAR